MTSAPQASKPQLLMLSSRVPYPLISGERLKTYNQIVRLSKHFDLHVVLIGDNRERRLAEEALKPVCKTLIVRKLPIWRRLVRTLTGLATKDPLQVAYFYDPNLQKVIDQLLPSMDVALATLVRTARYLEGKPLPKVLDMADSIGLNYRNSADATTSKIWRWIYRLESKRLIAYEKVSIRDFDRTLLFNASEMAFFDAPQRLRWIPHGTNETLLNRPIAAADQRKVGFLGKMDYQPNVDAVLWFAKQVLPKLPEDVSLEVLGTSPAKSIAKLGEENPRVHVTGFLEDPYTPLSECCALVAPMQTGGGIQNKILEAMALGLPVVTTTRAATPLIGAVPGEHLLVADTSESFVEAIMDVLSNPGQRQSMGLQARKYIQSTFTWDAFEAKLVDSIQEARLAHAQQ